MDHGAADRLDKSKHSQTGPLHPLRASEEALCMERAIPKASGAMSNEGTPQGILAEADLATEALFIRKDTSTQCV